MLVFSTHAFTEGDVLSSFFGWLYAISTHAFTEGDGVQLKRKFYWKRISTHAFTEGDVLLEIGILACNHFNSRLHGRRPDQHPERDYAENHFNSRLHGRRPHSCCWAISDHQISTHAFTEGDLLSCLWRGRWPFYFNSRLHGRRRPGTVIHASWSIFYFNSRLHGRRRYSVH